MRYISKKFIKFNKTTIQIKKKGKKKNPHQSQTLSPEYVKNFKCDVIKTKYLMHNQIQNFYPIIHVGAFFASRKLMYSLAIFACPTLERYISSG